METIIYKSDCIPDSIYESVSNLLVESFDERRKQGINFACGHFSAQDVKKHLNGGGYLLCVFENGQMIGTISLIERCKFKFLYVSRENLAISNSHKRKGIATYLFQEVLQLVKRCGYDFMSSCTAVSATSSVKMQLKEGCILISKSYGRDYNSFSFIYPLKKLKFLRLRLVSRCVYYFVTSINYIRKI